MSDAYVKFPGILAGSVALSIISDDLVSAAAVVIVAAFVYCISVLLSSF